MAKKESNLSNVLPEEQEVFENAELIHANNDVPAYNEQSEHTTSEIEIDPDLKASVDEQIKSITSKCTFNQDYVDDKVILSVNHLKQFFFFGKGPKKYKLKAVHDVNFQIKEGECFGIVGESGCGKTTTGRSIIRLYNITSGSIYYKGYRIGAGSRWNEKEIKYTKIRFKQQVEDLKKQLKEGTISQEQYNEEFAKAKDRCDSICTVQRAKIKQIKADNKKAPHITVNGDKIDAAKAVKDNLIAEMNSKIDAVKENEAQVAEIRASYQPKFDEIDAYIENLKSTNKKLMSEIQMIFQDPIDSLDPRMTVEDIIQEGLRIQGHRNKAENHQKVVEALEKVGLIADYANRYPHEFSGGQRQRIGIARALIMNPKLLICDEPISALDVSIRAQIINLLNDLKEEMGLTIIFIAHDLSVVKYFCDRIAVMYFGEIVELATSDELFKHPLHPYTKSLLSAIPKPNPRTEKNRKRIVYKPQEEHDYSVEKPKLVEIEPGHWILANTPEIEKYKEEIAELDKKAEE